MRTETLVVVLYYRKAKKDGPTACKRCLGRAAEHDLVVAFLDPNDQRAVRIQELEEIIAGKDRYIKELEEKLKERSDV